LKGKEPGWIHLRQNAGVYRIEWLSERCKVASTNAMLWLVTGVSSFGSSTSSVTPREPKEVTPPAPATEPTKRLANHRAFPNGALYRESFTGELLAEGISLSGLTTVANFRGDLSEMSSPVFLCAMTVCVFGG